jgi:hypothetical protein
VALRAARGVTSADSGAGAPSGSPGGGPDGGVWSGAVTKASYVRRRYL